MSLNLTSKKFIKNLLKSKEIRPIKRMGQNFLVRRTVLRKIIESSELKPRDIVLEIGPGIGTLTKELAQKVKKVIAVEKDTKMIEILKKMLESLNIKNVEIIEKDILKFQVSSFKFQENYKIVANLPYYIATPVIKTFLESPNPPKLMVLMIQKEVGERICSRPPKMQKLGVLIQARANVKIIETVKKDSFWPQPKVDSVILKIVPGLSRVFLSPRFGERFSRIVKAGFSQPRKQLINNFSKNLNLPRQKVAKWLQQNNIAPTQRAESLSLENWISLTKTF